MTPLPSKPRTSQGKGDVLRHDKQVELRLTDPELDEIAQWAEEDDRSVSSMARIAYRKGAQLLREERRLLTSAQGAATVEHASV